jgi:hypothetical protein
MRWFIALPSARRHFGVGPLHHGSIRSRCLPYLKVEHRCQCFLDLDLAESRSWSAEQDKVLLPTIDGDRFTSLVNRGVVYLPSGSFVVRDPFVALRATNNPHLLVPADVSPSLDRSTSDRPSSLRITEGA